MSAGTAASDGRNRDRQRLCHLVVLHTLDETQDEGAAVTLADTPQQPIDAHQCMANTYVFPRLPPANELAEGCPRLQPCTGASTPGLILAGANRHCDDERMQRRGVT